LKLQGPKIDGDLRVLEQETAFVDLILLDAPLLTPLE